MSEHIKEIEKEAEIEGENILPTVYGNRWEYMVRNAFNEQIMNPAQIGSDEKSLYTKAMQTILILFTPSLAYLEEKINSVPDSGDKIKKVLLDYALRGYMKGFVRKFNVAIGMENYNDYGYDIALKYIMKMAKDSSIADVIQEAMKTKSGESIEYCRKRIFDE